MIAPSITSIESDFADTDETLREYRIRTSEPSRRAAFRRFSRRLIPGR